MSLEDERERFWRAIEANSVRIDGLETSMHQTIAEVVRAAMPVAMPTAKQLQWIDLAIERETQSIAFRRKVIEASVLGVLALLGLAAWSILKEWAQAHGWRA